MKTNDHKPVKSGEEKRAARKSSKSGFHPCMDESLIFRTTMRKDDSIRVHYEGSGIHKYTFDTCTLIKIYNNPNLGTFLDTKLGTNNYIVYITEVSLKELEHNGYDVAEVILAVQKTISAKLVIKQVSISTRIMAEQLESKLSKLHRGDSSILAFSIETSSMLVTFDRDLVDCCKSMGLVAFNPKHMMETVAA